EREGTCRRRPYAPSILGHSGADAELIRLQRLDAVGVDDDVIRGAGDADEYRRDDSGLDAGRRIHERQVYNCCDYGSTGEKQPRDALAEPAQHRDSYAVDDPRPEHLEVVDEESEAECRDGPLVDAILRQACGQRGADHRVGKAGRDADEERSKRFLLEIRPECSPDPAAAGGARAPGFIHNSYSQGSLNFVSEALAIRMRRPERGQHATYAIRGIEASPESKLQEPAPRATSGVNHAVDWS